jgi:hypothetical protein
MWGLKGIRVVRVREDPKGTKVYVVAKVLEDRWGHKGIRVRWVLRGLLG